MTKILGFSGRAASGKSMSGNYLCGMVMKGADLVDNFQINERGRLVVPFKFGEEFRNEEFDLQSHAPEVVNWLAENLWPTIKLYSFADLLKTEVCMKVLGLRYEQLYGTDEEKNLPTKYLWENMPLKTKKTGPMSGRDVMQFVGTDLFRKMYPKIWAEATISHINREQIKYAVITDVRFPDEVEEIQNNGGKVIRLTRNSKTKTEHKSETALDSQNYDWAKFDKIIDNEELEIQATLAEVGRSIEEFGWLEDEGETS